MHTVRHIDALPDNLGDFVGEMAEGYGTIYGPDAIEWFSRTVGPNLEVAIRHPAVHVGAAFEDNKVIGIVFCHRQGVVGHISFLHVLRAYDSRGIDTELVRHAIENLKKDGVERILYEVIPFFEPQYEPLFLQECFTPYRRGLMIGKLQGRELPVPMQQTCLPIGEGNIGSAAQILCNTYAQHPDGNLHWELRDILHAEQYIRNVQAGQFGTCRPEYCRLLETDEAVHAVILGFEATPDAGFVMQVAVEPKYQGQGLGTKLLLDLAQAFRDRGLNQWSLGVTLENPAFQLYERLGLVLRRNVDVYIWERH